jgi:hypothetical protein
MEGMHETELNELKAFMYFEELMNSSMERGNVLRN